MQLKKKKKNCGVAWFMCTMATGNKIRNAKKSYITSDFSLKISNKPKFNLNEHNIRPNVVNENKLKKSNPRFSRNQHGRRSFTTPCHFFFKLQIYIKLNNFLPITGFCAVALGCSGACSGSAMVLKGRWEDVITPLPLRDVSFLPAVTVVADLADVQLVQHKNLHVRRNQRQPSTRVCLLSLWIRTGNVQQL